MIHIINMVQMSNVDDIYHEIGNAENYGDDIEYTHNHYYIGLPHYDRPYDHYLLASSIRNSSFFQYQYKSCYTYLRENSVLSTSPKVHIMQLKIPEAEDPELACYNVLLKTTWLQLIQRCWKKTYANRKQWFKENSFHILRDREQGRRIKQNPYQLEGMLSYLKVSK